MRGKVVIDAFRLIDMRTLMAGQQPRQTTSVEGHLNKPTFEAYIKGLNKYYYSVNVNYKIGKLEQQMLLSLHNDKWNSALKLKSQSEVVEHSQDNFARLSKWGAEWGDRIEEEAKEEKKKLNIRNTGKLDPKRHIAETTGETINKPTFEAYIKGLNKYYYSVNVN